MEIHVNWFAVVVASLAHFMVGFVWYSFLFMKPWMKEMGYDKMSKKERDKGKKQMPRSMAINFAALLVTAYVLSHVIQFSSAFYKVSGITAGLQSGFWIWLGFLATTALNGVAWEGRSWKLYAINVSAQLVGLLLMGSILAVWP